MYSNGEEYAFYKNKVSFIRMEMFNDFNFKVLFIECESSEDILKFQGVSWHIKDN